MKIIYCRPGKAFGDFQKIRILAAYQKKSDLFDLIKSLTKGEKKYFSQFAQRTSSDAGSNYLALFDTLSKMENYDEEVFLKRHSKKPFSKKFSATKNLSLIHI